MSCIVGSDQPCGTPESVHPILLATSLSPDLILRFRLERHVRADPSIRSYLPIIAMRYSQSLHGALGCLRGTYTHPFFFASIRPLGFVWSQKERETWTLLFSSVRTFNNDQERVICHCYCTATITMGDFCAAEVQSGKKWDVRYNVGLTK
jgi:hypothetical protein